MAHFYGIMEGQSELGVTRTGTKTSGLKCVAANSELSVVTILSERKDTNGEEYTKVWIYLQRWPEKNFICTIYEGPLKDLDNK